MYLLACLEEHKILIVKHTTSHIFCNSAEYLNCIPKYFTMPSSSVSHDKTSFVQLLEN